MQINSIGEIIEDFHALGHAAVPVYLLDTPSPVIFDAGFTALGPLYIGEIRKVLGPRSPAHLFLTHSHWDHIGAAALFKREWPEMRIGASRGVHDRLLREDVLHQIGGLNREAKSDLRAWRVKGIYEGSFEKFDLDDILTPGQVILLDGETTVNVLGTPGHTWDFLSYWVPEKKILVAAEAAGCDGVAEFLVDYDSYRESLDTMLSLDVEVLCTGHNLVLTGRDAKLYLKESVRQADEFVRTVERIINQEHGDVDRVVERIKSKEWDEKPFPKQPEKPYLLSTRARVQHILERMKRSNGSLPPFPSPG